jgi:hypothetical protein
MALGALNWKRLATQTLASDATVADTLDAIYNAFAATSYNNGDTRSAGNAQAWTARREQDGSTTEAVYLHPAPATSTTSGKNAVVFAGKDAGSISNFALFDLDAGPATAQRSTQSWGQDFLQNCLFVGHAQGVTNGYSDWSSFARTSATTSPYTSGGFTGYVRFGDAAFHGSGKIILYESVDAIAMVFVDGSSGTYQTDLLLAGGFMDPGSTDAADGELDYARYGLACGCNNIFSTLGSADSVFPWTGGNNNQEISIIWVPRSTTQFNVMGPVVIHKNKTPGMLNLPSGKAVKIPMYGCVWFTPFTFIGRFREISMFQPANAGNTVSVSSSIVGHTIGDATTPGVAYFSLLLDGSS